MSLKMKFHIPCLLMVIFFSSCTKSPEEKIKAAIEEYLKGKLKRPDTYLPISFSKLDTLKKGPDSLVMTRGSAFKVEHRYSVQNSNNDRVSMSVYIFVDKDYRVKETSTESLNGDPGAVTGNIYWKYNNFVGNRADAGSTLILVGWDSLRRGIEHQATADVQGNYKIEGVLPGIYFAIVQSKNTTACPDKHLRNLRMYERQFRDLFDFDINKYEVEMDEIEKIQSQYISTVIDSDSKKYGGLSAQLKKSHSLKSEMLEKAEKLIDSFPGEFKRKIKLYTGYSNSLDFEVVRVDEGKTYNINTDFGITCL